MITNENAQVGDVIFHKATQEAVVLVEGPEGGEIGIHYGSHTDGGCEFKRGYVAAVAFEPLADSLKREIARRTDIYAAIQQVPAGIRPGESADQPDNLPPN